MRVLLNILLYFRYELYNIDVTGAQKLDSIYHTPQKPTLNYIFWRENAKILPYIHDVVMDVIP